MWYLIVRRCATAVSPLVMLGVRKRMEDRSCRRQLVHSWRRGMGDAIVLGSVADRACGKVVSRVLCKGCYRVARQAGEISMLEEKRGCVAEGASLE